jgi:RNA polymerase sigma-70 factor (ECF subfamily)
VTLLRRQLEDLFDRDGRRLFICALAVTHCPELAEDAVQDMFCRLLRLDAAPRHLRAYAFRSVRNAAIDLARQRARTPSIGMNEDGIFDPADGPRKNAERNEFQRRVAETLLTLSEDERETIVQRLYGDLTFREIAETRELPLGTVVTWYRRGMIRLRERLEEHDGQPR